MNMIYNRINFYSVSLSLSLSLSLSGKKTCCILVSPNVWSDTGTEKQYYITFSKGKKTIVYQVNITLFSHYRPSGSQAVSSKRVVIFMPRHEIAEGTCPCLGFGNNLA